MTKVSITHSISDVTMRLRKYFYILYQDLNVRSVNIVFNLSPHGAGQVNPLMNDVRRDGWKLGIWNRVVVAAFLVR